MELQKEHPGACWLAGSSRVVTLRRAAGERQPEGRGSVRQGTSSLAEEENWEINEKGNDVAKTKHWDSVNEIRKDYRVWMTAEQQGGQQRKESKTSGLVALREFQAESYSCVSVARKPA